MVGIFPDVWLLIIGLLLLYYAITDGFDLGVGIISLLPGQAKDRGLMMDSLGAIWHINQTWLVVLGGMLFGAFPLFYSLLFSALYLPSMVMLFGFVFRGIAFDFREHSPKAALGDDFRAWQPHSHPGPGVCPGRPTERSGNKKGSLWGRFGTG